MNFPKRMLESSFEHFGESAEKGIFDKSFTILGFFYAFCICRSRSLKKTESFLRIHRSWPWPLQESWYFQAESFSNIKTALLSLFWNMLDLISQVWLSLIIFGTSSRESLFGCATCRDRGFAQICRAEKPRMGKNMICGTQRKETRLVWFYKDLNCIAIDGKRTGFCGVIISIIIPRPAMSMGI